MKKSGYRTIFHIYLIFFLSLLGIILAAGVLFTLLITVQKPDGTLERSDWPKRLTEDFREQIILINHSPQVKQSGIALLQENGVGLQILDASGQELLSYQTPTGVSTDYSFGELLELYETGRLNSDHMTAFIGSVSLEETPYTYILYVPQEISKVTMYLNGTRFASGKTVVILLFAILFLVILTSGVLYGFWITKAMRRLTSSIQNIASRSYLPIQNHGAFRDLYESLNTLDAEIKASDKLRLQTDKMREEWIANITHDLKTPLSPIKGYAEILLEDGENNDKLTKRYAGIMLKNAAYMETLLDDLKLTYQLENGMLPLKRLEQNIVRFLKELAIDILNIPEFGNRVIHFVCAEDSILYAFDQTLLTRAFRNLIVNAFIHGEAQTEITLHITKSDHMLQIRVADNGKGMSVSESEHLFDRYYRGTSTEQKTEGTGLGLAIAKSIVELHGGTVSVSSIRNMGTVFTMDFPNH